MSTLNLRRFSRRQVKLTESFCDISFNAIRQGEARPKRIDGGHKKKKTKVSHIKTPTLTEEVCFTHFWRCFKQLVCTLTFQVIAAASKPPEVNPFLQDYMDDMDQNLILCRYSLQTQSVRYFCQGAQLTHLKQNPFDIKPYLRNIGKRPKYWY